MQIFKDKHFVQTCFNKETKGLFYLKFLKCSFQFCLSLLCGVYNQK